MTVLEIKEYAEKQLLNYPEAVDINDVIAWVNDLLSEMGTDARKFSFLQLMADSPDVWYDLPGDCLKLAEVTDFQGQPYYFWRTDGTRIRFRDRGTYTLRYYVSPARVSSLNDVPDCPSPFYQAMAYYVAYRYALREGLEPATLATAYYNEFLRKYDRARDALQKRERYVVARKWS